MWGVQFWFYFVTSSLSSKAQSLVMVEAEGRRRIRKKLSWSPWISYCLLPALEVFRDNYRVGTLG